LYSWPGPDRWSWGGALIQGPYPVSERSGTLRRVTTQTLQRWICESCGYIYDPEDGDPDGGIPAGTAFDDIPDTWFCPVCGARKRDFTLYED
jgi:rubredoxin